MYNHNVKQFRSRSGPIQTTTCSGSKLFPKCHNQASKVEISEPKYTCLYSDSLFLLTVPSNQEPQSDFSQQTGYGESPRHQQTFNAQQDDYTSAYGTQRDVTSRQELTTRQEPPYLPQTETDNRETLASQEQWRQPTMKPEDKDLEQSNVPYKRDDQGFETRSPARRHSQDATRRQSGEREESHGRRRRQSGNYEAQREREDQRSQPSEHRRHRDDARDYRDDRQEGKEHRDETRGHRERRRRQSGDYEGQREREEYRGQRDEHRSHRRHSKKRGSLEGSEFQDVSL